MKTRVALLTCLLAVALTTVAVANPTWDAMYPKTGMNKGEIEAKCTINLAGTLETAGPVIVYVWVAPGGVVKKFTFAIPPGQKGAVSVGPLVVGTLTTGQNYNAVVEIEVVDKPIGMPQATFYFMTPAGQAVAK